MSPPEIETGGIAIDFLHELVHVHERFRENGEEKKKGRKGQMCSLQLIGAEALVLELITFSEAASVTSNPPSELSEAFFFNSPHLARLLSSCISDQFSTAQVS